MRLLDMGVPRYMVATSLQAVIAQRLVRVDLRELRRGPRSPTPQEREWLRRSRGRGERRTRFKRGRGCSHCNGTGFRGPHRRLRDAGDDAAMVEAAQRRTTCQRLRARSRSAQMAGQHAARSTRRALAAAGRTTVDEAMRISQSEE